MKFAMPELINRKDNGEAVSYKILGWQNTRG